MMQKVRDLYDFVALNWEMGDEVSRVFSLFFPLFFRDCLRRRAQLTLNVRQIYLFGFSRGAYTVRLLCSLLVSPLIRPAVRGRPQFRGWLFGVLRASLPSPGHRT